MSEKKWKTAQELMAELNSNPDFLRRKAEKEQRRKEREEHFGSLECPILDKLRTSGFDAPSITEVVKRFSPLPDEIVDVFINGVENSADVKLLESLIRGLGAATNPFDGRPLVKCYENFNDDNLRWVIANTIVLARPHSIDDWIEEALHNPVLGKTLRELGIDK